MELQKAIQEVKEAIDQFGVPCWVDIQPIRFAAQFRKKSKENC